MTRRRCGPDRTLGLAALLLAAVFLLFEFTPLDLALQDRCYDFQNARWVVDGDEPVGRLVFYDGPKTGIAALGCLAIALLIGPAAWRARLGFARPDLAVVVLTLASVPVLVGLIKSATNVFCPSEIRRYGGDVCYVKVLESYPADDRPAARGRCFPAAHPSGGFALVSLAWLRRRRAWFAGGVAAALGVGGSMGVYQMLKGAHYLGHTVVTMIVAWIVVLLWRRVLRATEHATVRGGGD